jgi:hypothetical protein
MRFLMAESVPPRSDHRPKRCGRRLDEHAVTSPTARWGQLDAPRDAAQPHLDGGRRRVVPPRDDRTARAGTNPRPPDAAARATPTSPPRPRSIHASAAGRRSKRSTSCCSSPTPWRKPTGLTQSARSEKKPRSARPQPGVLSTATRAPAYARP